MTVVVLSSSTSQKIKRELTQIFFISLALIQGFPNASAEISILNEMHNLPFIAWCVTLELNERHGCICAITVALTLLQRSY